MRVPEDDLGMLFVLRRAAANDWSLTFNAVEVKRLKRLVEIALEQGTANVEPTKGSATAGGKMLQSESV
jgi:hypothetical protein